MHCAYTYVYQRCLIMTDPKKAMETRTKTKLENKGMKTFYPAYKDRRYFLYLYLNELRVGEFRISEGMEFQMFGPTTNNEFSHMVSLGWLEIRSLRFRV